MKSVTTIDKTAPPPRETARETMMIRAAFGAIGIVLGVEARDLLVAYLRKKLAGNARAMALLRNPYATASKAPVDNCENSSHNPGAMGLLNDYLKSQGVPQSVQPQLAAKIDALVKHEIAGREAAPKLSEADLAAFKAHAAAHQWNPESKPKVAPSAFIKETFKDWLGRGLTRKHIFDAQENLAGAYSTEVSRDPSKRVAGLITTRETLPVGAPRPPSSRPVAELSEEKKAEKRRKDAAKMRRWRQSQQGLSL
jgi:hypothetical protein